MAVVRSVGVWDEEWHEVGERMCEVDHAVQSERGMTHGRRRVLAFMVS